VARRHSDGIVHFFHQAWHPISRDEPIASERAGMHGPIFCVIPAGMEADRARAVAGFWEFVASLGQQIGYALRDDPYALFDPVTGRWARLAGVRIGRDLRTALVEALGPLSEPERAAIFGGTARSFYDLPEEDEAPG
jgi:hypothetical protein